MKVVMVPVDGWWGVFVGGIQVGCGSRAQCKALADELQADSSKAAALRDHCALWEVQES